MRKRLFGYSAVTGLYRAAVFACLIVAMTFAQAVSAKAETRTLKLYNTHTKERVSITFKKNGRYVPSGLREVNRFLRDWRRNEITKIDPELLDLVWEVYRKVRAKKPIYVVSSYRSPATNNMLRKRSSGVAKNSQHTLGKAMDFYIPGVNLATLRAAGLRKQVGGVGYYPRSGSPFVHMDTGRVRHWPKMSRSQLAKVFPNGKTLHVPRGGKPLKGYKLALAESKSGKKRTARPTIVARAAPTARPGGGSEPTLTNSGDLVRPASADSTASQGGNLLTSLFRSNSDNSDSAQRSRVAAVRPTPAPTPPGALPGVKRSGDRTPAKAAAPATTAPPIPVARERTAPQTPAEEPQTTDAVVLAGIVPAPKPARIPADQFQVASADAIVSNTLDAQRIALEQSDTGASDAVSSAAIDTRFEVAGATPGQKPTGQLLWATQQAALADASISGQVPIPAQAPTDDPVAAIAAATGAFQPAVKPAAPTTLAYASATALPVGVSLRAKPSRSASTSATLVKKRKTTPSDRSVSGRIPTSEILDPLSGFVSLPDKSEPKLISGEGTTRNRLFASLSHPNQRALDNFLSPGNRFVRGGFEQFPYGALRTDRFDGPAVIVLPVTFAR